MRSTTLLTTLLLATIAGGCGDSTPAGPKSGGNPSDSGTEGGFGTSEIKALPFKAHYEARSVGVGPGQGCNARLFLEGEGTGTYLGNFTIKLSFCGRGDGTLDNGTGTFVAADGDLLDITFYGVSDRGSPVLTFTSYVTFTGGTGRFDGATGTGTVHGTFDTRTNSGPADWDGTITFPAKRDQ